MNYLKIVSVIVVLLFYSCKTDPTGTKKDASLEKKDTVKVDYTIKNKIETPKKEVIKEPVIGFGNIFSTKVTTVRASPTEESAIIGKISTNDTLQITEYTKKFGAISENNDKYYGQWIKINFEGINSSSGYILDYDVSYIVDKVKSLKQRDTVIVTNEISFLEQLKSDRVFLIETDTLNFDRFSNTDYYLKNIIGKEDYYYIELGELVLRNLNNVEFKGVKKVFFTTNNYKCNFLEMRGCENFLFNNFNFYYPSSQYDYENYINSENSNAVTFGSGYGYKGVTLRSSKNGKFLNTDFNGIGIIGVDIFDTNDINFFNCSFSNIHEYPIQISSSKGITLKNIVINDNISQALIQLKENNPESNHFTSDQEIVTIENSFIINNTSELLGFGISKKEGAYSEVLLKRCTIENNTFPNAFLEAKNYQAPVNVTISDSDIRINHVTTNFEEIQAYKFVINPNETINLKIINSNFNENDWAISNEEVDQYFSTVE
ncbi:right-handed parallel beta-helix repeat-containing protein [Aureibaculum sp. A20]|uniref:Right-handed parallel beta-helix repeat-containing protein n=1 Tax=Aureibaculum flavum TaxID=2795986 RepID=A0ABS0WR42_9FLAO|nr:right-handed parallel beta-helix repeat-containing protein [Aureibaculum flavum]MBJ2174431.1 right-handed parallel beta-helix repeat-containing protein [Aureibaculum flavum]